jgi:5-methylcytosine-specific restriction endonuclease McrA
MSSSWNHEDSAKLYISSEWKKFRKEYIKRTGADACEACSKPVSGFDLTLDHNPPLTKTGGTNAFDEASIVVLCRSCNSRKNNRLMLRQNYSNPKLVSL